MIARLGRWRNQWKDRQEWQFFSVLPKADGGLAFAWWSLLAVRALLPAAFAIVMGVLVGAVNAGSSLTTPLIVVGIVFVGMQVVAPIHQAVGANLGDRTAAWLYDRLTEACVQPPGIGHLEDPELGKDLATARDFDLGTSGPPLFLSMEFIAGGLVELLAGLASAIILFGYSWWAPFVLAGAWLSTHWLLRESGVWRDRNTDEVRAARQHADYAYRLAVDAPPAKELRLFGLVGWVIERFAAHRTVLHRLQYEATRMREKSVLLSVAIVLGANVLVFWALGRSAAAGELGIGQIVVFAQAAIGASLIAFGGLNWALDSAAAPVAAVLRFRKAARPLGELPQGEAKAGDRPGREIRFRDVDFGYAGGSNGSLVLQGFQLSIPAGESLAIVGRNGAGKTTLAKLLCRLYDPVAGAIEADGADLRELELESWRSRVTAVFQDYLRLDLTLRENVAPQGAPDDVIMAALEAAGAADLSALDTPLSKGYPGGTDLSGGQWQRVALARALCAVKQGARVVLLDEPTAQLDVRGEAEIFERVLAETRHCTTILISHC